MRLFWVWLAVLALVGCAAHSGSPLGAGADPATLRRAPTRITFEGRTLRLSTSLWRDMMPGPGPARPRVLRAVVTVVDSGQGAILDDVVLERLWVLNGDEVWSDTLVHQPTMLPNEHQASAMGGPEWEGGTIVTAVVQLRRRDATLQLRADDQRVELAH